MQCVLRRSNVCAIGRNATESLVLSSTRRQRIDPSHLATSFRYDGAIDGRRAFSHPPATSEPRKPSERGPRITKPPYEPATRTVQLGKQSGIGRRQITPNQASSDDQEAVMRPRKDRKRDRVKSLKPGDEDADVQKNREHATSSLSNISRATIKRSRWKEKNAEEGDDKPAKPAEDATEYEKSQWMIQKKALKEKFGDQAWNPKKRLSPDTLEGIRAMHASDPYRFTTPILAEHFEVSPEAIRRILKSKWLPAAEEAEARRERWERRGEKVWSSLAEIGVKPPKPWRVRGVGKGEEPGDVPVWKDRSRRGTGRVEREKAVGEAMKVRDGLVAERKSLPSSSDGLPIIFGRISDRML